MVHDTIRRLLRADPTLRRLRREYWRVRFHVLRAMAPSWRRHPGRLPVPPEPLRYLISGIPDYPVSDFLQMGQHCASLVEKTLLKNGIQLAALRAILDFGCGCGRTLRHLTHLKQTRLYGTDYSPTLVGWCRPNLAFAEFTLNGLEPPLAYADSAFDLVYVFSVFSHLAEPLQHAWMQELRRVIKPHGYLLISTMSAAMLSAAHGDEAQRRFASGELVVINASDSGRNACEAYHPDDYVRTRLARGFAVLDLVPGGGGQDVWLLRKEAVAQGGTPQLEAHAPAQDGSASRPRVIPGSVASSERLDLNHQPRCSVSLAGSSPAVQSA